MKGNIRVDRTTSYEELPQFLTATELMALMGISKNTAYKLIASKAFSTISICNQIRIPKTGVKSLMLPE